MKAKSIKGKSTPEITAALTECMADGYKPTIAIVFLSEKQDIEAISKLLDDTDIQLFGATTAGPGRYVQAFLQFFVHSFAALFHFGHSALDTELAKSKDESLVPYR